MLAGIQYVGTDWRRPTYAINDSNKSTLQVGLFAIKIDSTKIYVHVTVVTN